MGAKYCGHHHHHCRRKLYRRIAYGIGAFIVLVGITVFLIWVILRPTKPRFILQDVTVYNLNVSATPSYNTLSTTMQITISTKNPNDRIGVYYRKLDIYAAYRGQQITLATSLPSSYQGHNEITVWSPFVNGNEVPVSPDSAVSLREDSNEKALLFNIKIDGHVKWKVGTWISGKYYLNVNCPALIRFGDSNTRISVGPAIKYQIVQSCNVEVGL